MYGYEIRMINLGANKLVKNEITLKLRKKNLKYPIRTPQKSVWTILMSLMGNIRSHTSVMYQNTEEKLIVNGLNMCASYFQWEINEKILVMQITHQHPIIIM